MALSRRRFLEVSAAAAALSTQSCQTTPRKEGKRLNLLWIMTDQQPVNTIGAYGNDAIHTPHIDRIASAGVRFERLHISAFPCSPSRACFLTGRESHNHGVVTNDVLLASDVPTLGDVLSCAGYRTGYVGKWHLGGNMYRGLSAHKPFDGSWYFARVPDVSAFKFTKARGGLGEDAPQHGFDRWVGGWEHYRRYLREEGFGDLVETTSVGNHNDLPSAPDDTHAYSRLSEDHHMAAFFAREASEFLEAQQGVAEPFALVLSFYGPHLPVAPPKPWDEMYALDAVPLPANHRDELAGKPVRQRINKRCYRYTQWTEAQFRDYVRRYWGYCSYIDHQIGRVLAALEASGKLQDTIVLFTSDHGDMMGAHGFIYKLGACGYDELLRVPFILSCPGRLPAGTQTDALVGGVDVLPSLLELMDVPAPDNMDGHSLLTTLDGAAQSHRDVVVCNTMERTLTVVTDRWKYVLNWRPRDLDELYDLAHDPDEMTNLAQHDEFNEVVLEMRTHVDRWLAETSHPYRNAILDAMAQDPEATVVDVWPEVTQFEYLGNAEFTYTYRWQAEETLPKETDYWSFTHFTHRAYGTDGDIVFRDTTWPQPSTSAWKTGGEYQVGPVRIRIPDHAGTGDYEVRIGLYNPESRTTPGYLLRGQGNAVTVGTLTITRAGDDITDVRFRPQNP